MKKVLFTVIGLIVVHAATELWQLVMAIWPHSKDVTVNWFVDKSANPEGVSLLWWIKMLTDEILICYVFWDYAMTALKTSRKKFFVVFIFFIYHAFDGAMYLYNFKQSTWIYLALLGMDCAALLVLFLPVKEKAKVISLD